MRILIINQPFYPDVVATAQHLADWTSYLASKEGGGHTVTVICSRSVYGKQGAVLPKTDAYHGVTILRLGSNLFSKGRILTRLVDFGLFHLRALFKSLTLPKQDVVVCLTTPPFIGVVGMLTKALRGSKFVQYEMDLYPDVPVALGVMKPRSLPTRLFEAIHRKILRSADKVIVLGRCMQRVISGKGIPDSKMILVTPWADPTEITPIPPDQNPFRTQHNLQNKFVVLYAGNLGLGHDITTIASAMSLLKDDPAIHFLFVGGGKRLKEIAKLIEDQKLPNAQTLDYVPREALGQMLAAADVHLITQAPGTSGLIVPSKFYGILAAGRPSLYIGPADTEVAYTIAENQIGHVLPIGDAQGLVNAIRSLQATPPTALTEKTRALLERTHSRQVCTRRLTEMLESL